MDEYKFDLAQRFCERALEMDNDNVKALELTSSLLLEMGQVRQVPFSIVEDVFYVGIKIRSAFNERGYTGSGTLKKSSVKNLKGFKVKVTDRQSIV